MLVQKHQLITKEKRATASPKYCPQKISIHIDGSVAKLTKKMKAIEHAEKKSWAKARMRNTGGPF